MVNPIPPFPRHLSAVDRQVEARRIVKAIAADIATGAKPGSVNMDRIEQYADMLVFRIWTVERLAELEARVKAMDTAAQPAPAPAKRATLKLKGGTNG